MSSLKLKISVLVATAFFVSSTALSKADLSPSRFVTVQRYNGVQEVIDTAAPLLITDVKEEELSFYLYTIHNPNNPEILSLNVQNLASSKYFDKSKLNIISIHGWTSNYTSDSNSMVVDAYLKVTNVNILVFDWSTYAADLYAESFVSATEVGKLLGKYIVTMQDYFQLTSSSFHLVGHSMGGHIAGVAGKVANGNIDLLVGLDPAGPLYLPLVTYNRIEKSSAKHVQIIHTNAGQFGYLGHLGHAEYWPNGGINQPGCSIIDLNDYCSHHRSYKFFAESLLSGGFKSKSCLTYVDYTLNICLSEEESYLGGLNVDTKANGDYYLDTASAPPYSLN